MAQLDAVGRGTVFVHDGVQMLQARDAIIGLRMGVAESLRITATSRLSMRCASACASSRCASRKAVTRAS